MSVQLRCSLMLSGVVLAGLACMSAQEVKVHGPAKLTQVQGFKVTVALSDEARKKLVDMKETIVVFGYIYGGPKAGASKSLVSDMGEIGLGDFHAEISQGTSVTFAELALKQSSIEQVAGSPQVVVNVVSGRRSTQDNFLDCSIYDGELKKVQGTSIPIRCKLIVE